MAEHTNYMGKCAYQTEKSRKQKQIFILSITKGEKARNHMIVFWTPQGIQTSSLTFDKDIKDVLKPTRIAKLFDYKRNIRIDSKSIREYSDQNIQNELLKLEGTMSIKQLKIGVVFATQEQSISDDLLNNECGDQNFEKFLNLLGHKITLHGWKKFSGGLDCKNNTTGHQSFYTNFKGFEIMFHVSTLLPYSQSDPQQIERKRHIGNDLIVIVYKDIVKDGTFNPKNFMEPNLIHLPKFESKVTHIYVIVSYNVQMNTYSMKIYSKKGVPPFGPNITSLYHDAQIFRTMLLTKCINGEGAALSTPKFAQKKERLVQYLMQEMYDKNVKVRPK